MVWIVFDSYIVKNCFAHVKPRKLQLLCYEMVPNTDLGFSTHDSFHRKNGTLYIISGYAKFIPCCLVPLGVLSFVSFMSYIRFS